MQRVTKHTKTGQSGFVALFSVIFFALLASVITVGFIRMTVVEQQQALNNDLTARALAAAEAGVEDAKRVLARYDSLPNGSVKTALRAALDSNDCSALFRSTSPAVTGMVIENDNGEVSPGQNLFYTCLNVDLNTADYLKTIAKDENHVIPLRSTNNFNQVRLEWHLNSDNTDANGDGIPSNYPLLAGDLPKTGEFGNGADQPPAYLRAQLIGVPKAGAINRANLEDRSRTIFLMPFPGGGTGLSFQTADPRGFNQNKSSPYPVRCQSGGGVRIGEYACEATLTLPGGALGTATNDYYLQLTPLYRDTHIRARLAQNNEDRQFDAVQPRIDSTGRAADVFRRVEVRTNFPGDNYQMPRYGVSVGDNVCKQFQVTDNPAHYSDAAAAFCN